MALVAHQDALVEFIELIGRDISSDEVIVVIVFLIWVNVVELIHPVKSAKSFY